MRCQSIEEQIRTRIREEQHRMEETMRRVELECSEKVRGIEE